MTSQGPDRRSGSAPQAGEPACRVAVFTDETGWHTQRLKRALQARGASGRCVDLAACRLDTGSSAHGLLIPGFGRTLPDAALVRGIAAGSFEQVTRRLGVLHALQALGVPVYNDPRAIERSVDKAMTSFLLHAAGLPTPVTWAGEDLAAARRTLMREAAAGRALVLKPLFGSQGRGLQRLGADGAAGVPLPDDLGPGSPYGGVAYLQRFVPGAAGETGFDWRVLVIGGRARCAMRRLSAHWVHNVAQGARCEAAALDPTLADLACRAAQVLGLDYAGVDLMPSANGPVILEVNGVAAWRGLQGVSPVDIAQALVDDLLDRRLAGARRGLRAA